jgi:hypothetical protein
MRVLSLLVLSLSVVGLNQSFAGNKTKAVPAPKLAPIYSCHAEANATGVKKGATKVESDFITSDSGDTRSSELNIAKKFYRVTAQVSINEKGSFAGKFGIEHKVKTPSGSEWKELITKYKSELIEQIKVDTTDDNVDLSLYCKRQ